MLKKLKLAQPAALDVEEARHQPNARRSATIQRAMQPDDSPEKQKGPMRNAFITTNPLLPADYYVPKGVDKLVLEMNKGVKWGLARLPRPLHGQGGHVHRPGGAGSKTIEKIEQGSKMKSRLADAADKAHNLTVALRGKGVEAYEFHDRYQSIVTVGNFRQRGQADAQRQDRPRSGPVCDHGEIRG